MIGCVWQRRKISILQQSLVLNCPQAAITTQSWQSLRNTLFEEKAKFQREEKENLHRFFFLNVRTHKFNMKYQ